MKKKVTVYALDFDLRCQAIRAEDLMDAELERLYLDGSLATQLRQSTIYISDPKKKRPDIFRGVASGWFCVDQTTAEKLELKNCIDIDLVPVTLEDGSNYYNAVPKNIIMVRDVSLPGGLPSKSNPNAMLRIDPNHPLLNRTMLFKFPVDGKGINAGGQLLFASVDGDAKCYNFLQRCIELGLKGFDPVKVCESTG